MIHDFTLTKFLKRGKIFLILALFRMDLFEIAHGWWEQKGSPP